MNSFTMLATALAPASALAIMMAAGSPCPPGSCEAAGATTVNVAQPADSRDLQPAAGCEAACAGAGEFSGTLALRPQIAGTLTRQPQIAGEFTLRQPQGGELTLRQPQIAGTLTLRQPQIAGTATLTPQIAGTLALAPRLTTVTLSGPEGQPQGQKQTRTFVKVVQQDDSGAYELVIENGEPRATVNGKQVPEDRVKETRDGVWVIQSKDGKALATFHIGRAPSGGIVAGNLAENFQNLEHFALAQNWAEQLPQMASQFQYDPSMLNVYTQGEQPKTMLGVVMGAAPKDALENADVEDGEGIVLERVIDGLPAAEAGLQKGDIIVVIEGASEVTPEGLRALLRQKKPGDTIEAQALRDGKRVKATIVLAGYDAEKLGLSATLTQLPRAPGMVSGLSAEARSQMEQAMKALEKAEREASGSAREAHEQARRAIEEFVGALEQMEKEGLSTGDAMRGELGQWFGQFKDDQMVWGDKPGMVFTLPQYRLRLEGPGDNFAQDLNQNQNRAGDQNVENGSERETSRSRIRQTDVEARLEALSDRLERIEKLLEKIADDGA